jgi:alpha-1,3-rhamnosyl/mannosyltransferase
VADAGLRVEPLDADAWAAALHALLDDAPRRASLSAAGLRRAGAFGWERAAAETVEVYRRAIAHPPGVRRSADERAAARGASPAVAER